MLKTISRNFPAALALLLILFSNASAGPTEFKKINGFLMGERLLDVVYHLGYAPTALVGGCGSRVAAKFEGHSVLGGCTGRMLRNEAKNLKALCRDNNIDRVISEKGIKPCSGGPDKPLSELLGKKSRVTLIDFSKGLVPAIHEIAGILGCPEKGEALAATYGKAMEKALAGISKTAEPKKIVVPKGIHTASGKGFLQVEAATGPSGHALLPTLGLESAGPAMASETAKASHGFLPLHNLKKLSQVSPDVIVVMGDAFVVQRELNRWAKSDPKAAAAVPALFNHAVFTLPPADSEGALGYPGILNRWASTLKGV
ncbi:MAG: hypothetical protein MI862_09675 [Desulfobacterales bacterium]|nr:hypothetical protein [Desulfobacterales bacterium]